jgi:hypothetical protein
MKQLNIIQAIQSGTNRESPTPSVPSAVTASMLNSAATFDPPHPRKCKAVLPGSHSRLLLGPKSPGRELRRYFRKGTAEQINWLDV